MSGLKKLSLFQKLCFRNNDVYPQIKFLERAGVLLEFWIISLLPILYLQRLDLQDHSLLLHEPIKTDLDPYREK